MTRCLCYYYCPMIKPINNLKYLQNTRKSLRNNLTLEETILWNILKNNNLRHKFRRQHSIGNYIVDFYCPSKKLIIELDGSQHLDNQEYDEKRSCYFESLRIKVVRFWNNEIKENINGVVMRIEEELYHLPSSTRDSS
jgi:very-short-patch-repair endonuclease